MEGSPVRGQERSPLARLSESRDIQSFQAELVRTISADFHRAEVFMGLFETEVKTLQIPSWVRSHLERHPALHKKLQQGEMAGISHTDDNPVPRPASVARTSVVVIPLITNNALQGMIGLVSPMDATQLSAEEIDRVRQLAYDASPILARLQEIEALSQKNRELQTSIDRISQAEQALTTAVDQRNALDAFIQMQSHLQANVAHELRTPLAAVRGYTRMILDGRGGEVNTTQRDYLRIVTENTNRLIGLVSWMSYVSELSAQHLALTSFDLRDAWASSVNSLRQRFADKLSAIQEHIPNEPFLVVGDKEKLGYVLTELLAAAFKSSTGPGNMTVEFSHGREKEVTVKIAAKTASIPVDALNKIFERSFNTLAKPPQQTESDTINLAGVYDVIGMHGGRVFVNSTAGQGATFLFTLPAVTMGGEEYSHEQAVNSGRRRR